MARAGTGTAGLSELQWHILKVLPPAGADRRFEVQKGMRLQEIVTEVRRHTRSDQAVVSRAIRALEKRGLVERLPTIKHPNEAAYWYSLTIPWEPVYI